MRRVFRTRSFSKWMKKAGVTDNALCGAVSEMVQGLIDADLGGGILKKRIAIFGRGKRGGARTIVATRMTDRWFFLYGFEKNEKSNIDKDELKALQELAKQYLEFSAMEIDQAIEDELFSEICNG
ncbi:MAG: type II toxin-antitoxin system RelE/ParE family toxin, partial [Gammaproteobacteria bacterium]|nr:type II toxin-antitoxin system RelE/ParE family toxin [Gammaproteobacteria bacterium]